ncbi:MAG: hypothetical protein ACRDHC_00445 [Actinomycetota bacterium]
MASSSARAEETLTEIKVAQGLSERHEAAVDPSPDRLGEAIENAHRERRPSLDEFCR